MTGKKDDPPLRAARVARVVECPRCRAPVEWTPAARFRPFCSERCKVIDLGDWAMERYRVADEGEGSEGEGMGER